MAEKTTKTAPAAAENGVPAGAVENRFVDITRKVLWAGLGAVALAQEEAAEFVDRLVERGELAEQDARRLMRELTQRKAPETAQAAAEADKVFAGFVRRVLRAGLGAAAMTQENAENFIDKLIERGELAEQDGRKLIEELKERRQKRARAVEEALGQRLEEALARLNVPSKSDIEALSAKITRLTEKVEELELRT